MTDENKPDERKTVALPADLIQWVEDKATMNHLTFSAQLRMILLDAKRKEESNAE